MKDSGHRQQLEAPLCFFCHHKTGTQLLGKVLGDISQEFRWELRSLLGKQTAIPDGADITLYQHSQVDPNELASPFRGVHFRRDPRDIVVSGYLYHQRTSERWCVNEDFSQSPPVQYPQVPYSQEHRPERWKADYLESLQGRSYQENLHSMAQSEGLKFEMDHYAAWTVGDMLRWDYANPDIIEVKFEELMSDYDGQWRTILQFLGISGERAVRAIELVAAHDLGRKSDEDVAADDHVSSRKTSQWREYFDEDTRLYFKRRFPDALQRLGYERDDAW